MIFIFKIESDGDVDQNGRRKGKVKTDCEIFIYMGVNIAMTIGYAPVVGVPLPMFSYGGSSFINFIILFAIMQNLITFRYKDMYDARGTKSFV